jgi:hypothetical protein
VKLPILHTLIISTGGEDPEKLLQHLVLPNLIALELREPYRDFAVCRETLLCPTAMAEHIENLLQ